MGLLDDAIREHLDLKRKHGADPDEVERLEQEALHAEDPPAEPEPETTPDPGNVITPEESIEYDEAIESETVMEETEVPLGTEMVSDDPPAKMAPPLQETVEIDEIDFAPPSEDQKDEEVPDTENSEPEISEGLLDKTPDFLEDTPEHDRLWFEQKQPKDFDFDG